MTRKTKFQARQDKLQEQSAKVQKFVDLLKARELARWAEAGLKNMNEQDAQNFAMGYITSMLAGAMVDSKAVRDEFAGRLEVITESAKQYGI